MVWKDLFYEYVCLCHFDISLKVLALPPKILALEFLLELVFLCTSESYCIRRLWKFHTLSVIKHEWYIVRRKFIYWCLWQKIHIFSYSIYIPKVNENAVFRVCQSNMEWCIYHPCYINFFIPAEFVLGWILDLSFLSCRYSTKPMLQLS